MDIILKILMILGILILVIVGLILLTVIIILAAPITYRADASAEDGDISANISVKWLLFIKVPMSFEKKELKYAVKLFGVQIFPKVEKPEKGSKTDEKTVTSGDKPKEQVNEEVRTENEKKVEPVAAQVVESEVGKKVNPEVDSAEKTKTDNFGSTDEEPEKQKESIWVKLDKLVEKVKAVWGICEQEKEEVERFFKRKSTKYTFEVLKKDILKLLNHIRPRKLTGNVEFGFDDPSTTGYMLAALSVFYGLYCENLEISPDFTGKVLNGNVKLSGRVFLGYIVYIALDIYLRKRVRMFIKNVIALKDISLENVDKVKNQFISGDTAEAEI